MSMYPTSLGIWMAYDEDRQLPSWMRSTTSNSAEPIQSTYVCGSCPLFVNEACPVVSVVCPLVQNLKKSSEPKEGVWPVEQEDLQ
uniref:Uncharacterized protein n=1 Tax=Mesocestoides corti TaxID=53468 RepID=A0A5K3FXB5_MESCO